MIFVHIPRDDCVSFDDAFSGLKYITDYWAESDNVDFYDMKNHGNSFSKKNLLKDNKHDVAQLVYDVDELSSVGIFISSDTKRCVSKTVFQAFNGKHSKSVLI